MDEKLLKQNDGTILFLYEGHLSPPFSSIYSWQNLYGRNWCLHILGCICVHKAFLCRNVRLTIKLWRDCCTLESIPSSDHRKWLQCEPIALRRDHHTLESNNADMESSKDYLPINVIWNFEVLLELTCYLVIIPYPRIIFLLLFTPTQKNMSVPESNWICTWISSTLNLYLFAACT
jgi:hypothetical protein